MTDQPKISLKASREKDRSPIEMPNTSITIQRDRRYVDITAMIRSLQRTEGNTDCFRRGQADCDQLECAWRQYCLGSAKSVFADTHD